MKIGGIYLLRGGLVLRYQGLYANRGPCLAFRHVSEGVQEPPVGYSADIGQVLREVTSADLDWIKQRRDDAVARDLLGETTNMDHLLKELTT